MSILLSGGSNAGGTASGVSSNATLKAYSDPVIFRDDRVLKTLLRKESKYLPSNRNYFSAVQNEIKPHNRKEVADWMLEVCEDQGAQPEVFVLAMNYLDRFLSVCTILRSQLQLLGSVCLLVSWKVREHEPLPAIRLIEYSDYNLTLMDIMEWEVLLLSKLDWDMSAVIASDFVEHIIQRVRKLHVGTTSDVVRRHSETLITMCSSHFSFSSMCPSLVAAASVLVTLRPLLEADKVSNDREPYSDMDLILESVEKITQIEQCRVRDCMDKIESLMRSPMGSTLDKSRSTTPEPLSVSDNDETPTKVHDVARKYNE